jgi:hypothetical protein
VNIEDLRKLADKYGHKSPVSLSYHRDKTWHISVGDLRARGETVDDAIRALGSHIQERVDQEVRELKARLEGLTK